MNNMITLFSAVIVVIPVFVVIFVCHKISDVIKNDK